MFMRGLSRRERDRKHIARDSGWAPNKLTSLSQTMTSHDQQQSAGLLKKVFPSNVSVIATHGQSEAPVFAFDSKGQLHSGQV